MLSRFLDRFRFSVPRLVARFEIPRDGVLHVGANFGQEADEYDALGFGLVVWIEGYAPYFERLLSEIAARPNHVALQLMVSDVEGEEVNFSVASNTGSSTALKATEVWQRVFADITLSDAGSVACGRIDAALDAALSPAQQTALRFMVLDIEGSEMKALRSLGRYLDHLEFALIEISVRENFEGGPLLPDIDAFMAAHGFARCWMKLSASSGDALYRRVGEIRWLRLAMQQLSGQLWLQAAALRLTDAAMRLRVTVKEIVGR